MIKHMDEAEGEMDYAAAAVAQVLGDLPDDICPGCVAYSMFIELTHLLAENGWTAWELCRDVRHHVADHAMNAMVEHLEG